jgi:RimJ/RimL family protein N-acetyltransferase
MKTHNLQTRSTNTRSTNTRSTKKTRKYSLHTARKQSEKLKLVSLAVLNPHQANQLSRITRNINIMKWIGTGKIWSLADIHQFIADEKKELAKSHEKYKQYYSFVLLKDNLPIGFISGRKSRLLDAPAGQVYDLLLRMFIDEKYTGRGYGTRILEIFYQKYKRILKNDGILSLEKVKLVSDIDASNIASIKIHKKNNFIFSREIIYKDGKKLHRYTRSLAN